MTKPGESNKVVVRGTSFVKRFFLLISAFLLILPAARGEAAGASSWLTLTAEDSIKPLACLPVGPGEAIVLDYVNSIYRAPVRETLVFSPGEGLVTTQVETPHAGVFEYLGLIPDEPGRARLRRKLGNEIRLLSSDYESHRITIGGAALPLTGLVPDGRPIVLGIRAEKCLP